MEKFLVSSVILSNLLNHFLPRFRFSHDGRKCNWLLCSPDFCFFINKISFLWFDKVLHSTKEYHSQMIRTANLHKRSCFCINVCDNPIVFHQLSLNFCFLETNFSCPVQSVIPCSFKRASYFARSSLLLASSCRCSSSSCRCSSSS